MKSVRKQLKKMPINAIRDVVYSNGIGRNTKELERIGLDKFYVHDFSNGWLTASLNLKQATKYVKGTLDFLDIDWV